MTAKDWWLDRTGEIKSFAGSLVTRFEAYDTPKYDDLIHVREMKPGMVTVSRDDLRAAWLRAHGESYEQYWKPFEREIFGESK